MSGRLRKIASQKVGPYSASFNLMFPFSFPPDSPIFRSGTHQGQANKQEGTHDCPLVILSRLPAFAQQRIMMPMSKTWSFGFRGSRLEDSAYCI